MNIRDERKLEAKKRLVTAESSEWANWNEVSKRRRKSNTYGRKICTGSKSSRSSSCERD